MRAKYWKRPTSTELHALYIEQQLSLRAIGKLTGAPSPTVGNWLRKAGIRTRTISEAKQGQGPAPQTVRASVSARRKYVIPGKETVGYKVDCYGYVLIWNVEKQGYEKEHRLVMEAKLGRKLRRREDVHHINGDRKDNSPENLELFESRSAHQKHHEPGRRRIGGRFA